jgi:hypothetical protein
MVRVWILKTTLNSTPVIRIARLAVNMRHDSRLGHGQRFEHLGRQWPKYLNIVAWRVDDDDSDRKTGIVLLTTK